MVAVTDTAGSRCCSSPASARWFAIRHASKAFYRGPLRLPLEAMPDDPDYLHGENLAGVQHFALWPLARAAESCFGTGDLARPTMPVPHSWLEFDVEDVAAATRVLADRGYPLLVRMPEGAVGPDGDAAAESRGDAGRHHVHAVAAVMEKRPARPPAP